MALKYWITGGALAVVLISGIANWQADEDDTASAGERDAPPTRMPLDGLPTPPSGALTLTDVTTVGAQRQRLRLNLPAGVGGLCELTADAPPENGHALIWRPRIGDRVERMTMAPLPSGQQGWELTTDDGRRQYFYGIDVTTHLHCDGTPRWRSIAVSAEAAGIVNTDELPGHPLDPAMPALPFFERTRFLDAKDRPLRPIRRDAPAQGPRGDAIDELTTSTLGDYLQTDGTLRFWGSVARIRFAELSGEAIDRQWHDRLEAYE